MRYGLGHTLKKLAGGQSLARIYMNVALADERITGKTVDVGGGRSPDYFSYLAHDAEASVEAVDGSTSNINFETDRLPYDDGAVDTALMCNILEHIYHHGFLLSEAKRVLRSGGHLVGFVPFWVGYHPDPHDYFRYTKEALQLMLTDAGFSTIKVRSVGGGPFRASFNTIALSLPRFLRPVVYLLFVPFDSLMLKIRPHAKERYPLGFVFTATA